jgi:hypothetical protein
LIDASIRHWLHCDPLDMTIHQSLIAFEEIGRIENGKAGYEDHRLIASRMARQMRMKNGNGR